VRTAIFLCRGGGEGFRGFPQFDSVALEFRRLAIRFHAAFVTLIKVES
jgi:hypothetical protein